MSVSKPLRWVNQQLIPHYRIDEFGIVTSTLDSTYVIPSKKMCSYTDKNKKYYQYVLVRFRGRDRWRAIHRLMCYSWLGAFPHPLRYICDHINGDSLENNLWNLRYLTIRGNNLNRKNVVGVVSRNGLWCPRIAGFVHKRFGHEDKQFAQIIRRQLLDCYIRYTNRCPGADGYPHHNITSF